MRQHVIGLALLTVALTTPAWADDKGMEDEKLIVTWALTSAVSEGKSAPVPEGTAAFIFSKGGKVVIQQKGKADTEGTFKVNTTRTPGQINVTVLSQTTQKVETFKGVYQVDGDTLKLALANDPGEEGPTSFDKARKSLTLKRQKP
jgi:uncharacterized protein (TIGR03067 family)